MSLDESTKRDLNYALEHHLSSLDLARAQRLKVDAEAAEATREAARLAHERAREEREAHLREVLARHPDRWVVSLNGKRLNAGKKQVLFQCPGCGAELPGILNLLGDAMAQTFPRFLAEDFSNHNGRASTVASDLNCAKCGERCMFRLIPVPF